MMAEEEVNIYKQKPTNHQNREIAMYGSGEQNNP